jgi:histidinol-phosphate aminotransferase
MNVASLLREDLRDFTGYRSARSEAVSGETWLNANESPWPNPADDGGRLRRYPAPQPEALRAALAELYGVEPAQLLAGRGSDEAIDLLVRACCRPGADAVAVAPPTFGMYAVCARLHGTRVVEVPLIERPLAEREAAYALDIDALAGAALREGARLVFVCSPGNPTGHLVPLADIGRLAELLHGRAMVVVDEAYAEYTGTPSAATLLPRHDNLAVLRTLSKAHALAAARVGCVLAAPELIATLQRCQAPYPLPTPSVEAALAALRPEARATTRAHVALACVARDRLLARLRAAPQVLRAYDSRANFVLVRLREPQACLDRWLAAGIVVRDLRATAGLEDALRIGVGTPEQNARVLRLLAGGERAS